MYPMHWATKAWTEIQKKKVLTHLTSAINHLEETNKIVMDQIKTMTEKNARLTENCGNKQKQGVQATALN